MEGTLDEAQKIRTMSTGCKDPMTGKQAEIEMITALVGDDEHPLESYNQGPNGNYFKSMEIIYRRE
jgi:hypothetical protein